MKDVACIAAGTSDPKAFAELVCLAPDPSGVRLTSDVQRNAPDHGIPPLATKLGDNAISAAAEGHAFPTSPDPRMRGLATEPQAAPVRRSLCDGGCLHRRAACPLVAPTAITFREGPTCHRF